MVGQEVSLSVQGLPSTLCQAQGPDKAHPAWPGKPSLQDLDGGGDGIGATAGWELSLHLRVGFFRHKGVEKVIPKFTADAKS